MNTCKVKYKEEIIWVNSQALLLLKLLLIEQINDVKSDIKSNILENFNSLIEWDLDNISTNNKDLFTSFKQVKNRLTLNPQYYLTNEFAHKIYPLISRKNNKKETSKILSNLSNKKERDILKFISKILNLYEGKLMFKTVEVLSIDELIGNWKSTNIDEQPDFELNFNMTDLTPLYNEVKIVIKSNNDINVIIPARDYTNPKITEISLLTGKCEVNEGHLLISKDNWTKKIPILRFDTKTMEAYIFKTNITFKKTIR